MDKIQTKNKPVSLRVGVDDLAIMDAAISGQRGRSSHVNSLLQNAVDNGLGFNPKIKTYKELNKKTVLVSLEPNLVKSVDEIADNLNLKVNFLITLIIHNYANSQKGDI